MYFCIRSVDSVEEMEIEMIKPGRYVLSLIQQAMSIPTCQMLVLLLREVFGPSLTSQSRPSLTLANSYMASQFPASFITHAIVYIPAARTAYNMYPFEPHRYDF
jgi:hypothetical protein